MGNTPSKNASSNPSLTQANDASSEESSDESGSSGYICNQQQYHEHYIKQQQHQQRYQQRFTKAPGSLSKTATIQIPKSPTVNASSTSNSTSPITPSSSLSTPSTVDTMLSSSSSSVEYGTNATATPKRRHSSRKVKGTPSGLPINDYIDRLLSAKPSSKGFCLEPQEIRSICAIASGVFLSQPVLLELGTPVKVVGDVHGQYGDLMRIFQTCGLPPKSNYLFLGDYVDRGKQSLETIMLLFCLKIKFPENVFLLRGNHECASVTKVYGFYDECKRRCSIKIWKTIVDVFNTLPIAATIGGKIFCVHGGLSPTLNSMDDITNIQRPTDVPDTGLLSDLLWSDPDAAVHNWGDNDRGVSYCFGKSVVDKFCRKFGFDLIARGHMVVEDGYEFFNHRKLVTVFSAPNYCGEFQNWGAVMSVNKDLLCSFDLLKPLDNNNGVKRAVKVVQEAVYKRGSP